MFYVGQQVVCVNDTRGIFNRPDVKYKDEFHIQKGIIYTVKELAHNKFGVPTLILKELPLRADIDRGYSRERFRPLVKQHKGMETLNAILKNPKKKIKSDQFDKEEV